MRHHSCDSSERHQFSLDARTALIALALYWLPLRLLKKIVLLQVKEAASAVTFNMVEPNNFSEVLLLTDTNGSWNTDVYHLPGPEGCDGAALTHPTLSKTFPEPVSWYATTGNQPRRVTKNTCRFDTAFFLWGYDMKPRI